MVITLKSQDEGFLPPYQLSDAKNLHSLLLGFHFQLESAIPTPPVNIIVWRGKVFGHAALRQQRHFICCHEFPYWLALLPPGRIHGKHRWIMRFYAEWTSPYKPPLGSYRRFNNNMIDASRFRLDLSYGGLLRNGFCH
ncbi:hypothetical protein M378DRAFT_170024 [Amanita muscaria Koide BX008]|uniref:Uncharacterized protein n=1 Tax=Amanita muscaria (strain Koide BX008) TaxID=946122 RepID=A0A0C2WCA2_AMAMK|nr:hypothetical protein M378DRAFT_170024 [Amanita muscaria Koide BX008]